VLDLLHRAYISLSLLCSVDTVDGVGASRAMLQSLQSQRVARLAGHAKRITSLRLNSDESLLVRVLPRRV
jgi:hypothetical protein